MKIGIYLAAFKADHSNYNIVYQDINGKRDIGGDMLFVDLSNYDYIIATPPCNYWSRANYRRDRSDYSLNTKHLLPCIIDKLINYGKPFIVENVRNDRLFEKYGLLTRNCNIYKIGRHTYWTNVKLDIDNLVYQNVTHIENISRNLRQGGEAVHEIIERFLKEVN